MKTNFFTFTTQLLLVLYCTIFTTKSLAQSRPEMVVILDNTISSADKLVLQTKFHAMEIGSTLPSGALLWQISGFPFTIDVDVTVNGIPSVITYQINNIGDAVERGKNQAGIRSSSSNYDISIPNSGQFPCPFGIDGQDSNNTLLPFCNSLIDPIPDITCAVKVAILDTKVDRTVYLNSLLHTDYYHDCITSISTCTPNNFHGTKVASVLAYYLKRISGSQIISIKVLNDCGQGTVFDAIRGIDKANLLNVDIINMSFIGQDEVTANQKTPLEVAIDLAKDSNILAVEAAGNNDIGINIDYRPIYPKIITTISGSTTITTTTNYKVAYPPASLENTNSIVVGSCSCDIKKSIFSNYGEVSVDIYAPGELVLTQDGLGVKQYSSGTSFATPIVSGIAALLKCANPNVDSLKKATLNYAKTVAKAVYIAPDTTKNFTFSSGSQPVMKNEIIDVSVDDVTCYNACNGTIKIKVKGNTKPYNYKWGNNSSNGSNIFTISGLCAGVHCVTITDELNCPIKTCITITEPPALSINTTSNATCFGQCNGAAMLNVNGGTAPYQYQWSNNLGNSSNINNLCAGSYTCTVTDANGCTQSVNVTITESAPLNLTPTVSNVICNGQCNGSISVTTSGGIAPYQYQWSNLANSSNINGLCAGSYTCTATDANGCTQSVNVTITEPPALALSSSKTNVTCNGGFNGSIILTPSGGVPVYTYTWSPVNTGSSVNGNTISGLNAGLKSITITDANGCAITLNNTITQPSVITVTTANITITNISCNGGTNGAVALRASGGGLSGYRYTWSTGVLPTSGYTTQVQTKTGLVAGIYIVTITNSVTVSGASGCPSLVTVTVTEPAAISVTTTQTNVLCNGQCTGSINVATSGGILPYSYQWSNNTGNSSNINSLCAGNYTCTVTDAKGCTKVTTVTITEPLPMAISITSTNVTCFGQCNGSINITPSSGIAPYQYQWSNLANSSNINNLCAGSYTCTVTDANGCTQSVNVTITAPAPLNLTPTVSNILCHGKCTGSISVTASGGTGSYSYQWSNNIGTSSNINSLCVGSYTCTVTDANGCTQSVNVTITEPPALTLLSSKTNVTCNGGFNGSIILTPSGGVPTYTYVWSPVNTGSSVNGNTISGLNSGVKSITLTDANGCAVTLNQTIAQPTPLNLTSNVSNVICNGQCNGSISITASGGTVPYQYQWSNSLSNLSNINSLCVGSYTCTVTDANGCSKMSNVTITAPAAVTVSVGPDITLNGVNTSITLTAVSNASTYLWNTTPAQTTSSIIVSPTVTTTYIVTVTNGNGCTARDAVLITVPVPISTSYAVAFANPIINGNKLRVDIKMYSYNNFYIGSSNFRFNYNKTALSNLSIVSSNFPASSFNNATLLGTNPNAGIASVNVVYKDSANTNVLLVPSTGIELLTLEFDIINHNLPLDLVWRTNISPAPYNTIPRCTVLDDDRVSVIPIIKFTNFKSGIQIAAITALESDYDYLRTINFPLSDPYAAAPFNTSFLHINNGPLVTTTSAVLAQTGSNAIVDWIFIELRTGISGSTTVAYTQAGLLKKDGNIVSTDGVSPLYFPNAVTGNYYVAVRHRNHLGFRTNSPVAFGLAPVALNFTNNSIPLYGINPMYQKNPPFSPWSMQGGDANFDGSIDSSDSAIWEAQNGSFDDYFFNADYNLDGSIDGPDSGIWEIHNGKYQELD